MKNFFKSLMIMTMVIFSMSIIAEGQPDPTDKPQPDDPPNCTPFPYCLDGGDFAPKSPAIKNFEYWQSLNKRNFS